MKNFFEAIGALLLVAGCGLILAILYLGIPIVIIGSIMWIFGIFDGMEAKGVILVVEIFVIVIWYICHRSH